MTRLRHRFELRLAVMAMAALVIAQLGAMTHAYSHDAARSPSPHFLGAVTHNPCGDCLAFAPLLSAAGACASLPVLAPAARHTVAGAPPASLVAASAFLAFRSRAPPRTA